MFSIMSRSKAKKTTNSSTTNKTKMVTLRVPNDIAILLPEKDKTEWILDAIKEKIAIQKKSKTTPEPKKITARIGVKYAEIVTPNGSFKTQIEAAKAYGCAKRTFSDWLRNKSKPEFYGITLEGDVIGK